MGLSLRGDFTQLRGVGRTCSCNTRIVCQLGRAYIFSALEKKGAEYVLSTKEERQKKYRQSDGFILPKKVGNATGGKGATYDDIQERNLSNIQRLT